MAQQMAQSIVSLRRTRGYFPFFVTVAVVCIFSLVVTGAPVLVDSTTAAFPTSVDRFGAATTNFSLSFTDLTAVGPGAFWITFKVLGPYGQAEYIVADSLQDGLGGMSITPNGGGLYTATIDWNPPDNALVGSYKLLGAVNDSASQVVDQYANNVDELSVTNAGENDRPVVRSDAIHATPSGVERIGTNTTTLSASFVDADLPGVAAFAVTFKLREPDDIGEMVLAAGAINGQSGVTITDVGGGSYTASVAWDPADAQLLGYYDLYFGVSDGIDSSYDAFVNNLEELQVYDAISNNLPTLLAGATSALPISVNRTGSEYTMLKSAFSDADIPGKGAFTISFTVREPGGGEVVVVNAATDGQQGLRLRHLGGADYEASVLWDPDVTAAVGLYDLQFEVIDNQAASVTDAYASNSNELTVTSSAVLGDGYLLHRTNDSSSCGGETSACHNLLTHKDQDCRVCHTPHATNNIYLVRDTIQTPNSGPREVDFRTSGIGDPYNDPDPTPGIWAGAMADDADGIHTGVCEVCHTTVNHHRNDDSHSGQGHNNALICSDCHSHVDGFSSGESGGGSACACHVDIFNTMDSTATTFRHILANTDANYSPGASGMYTIKNCLSCHVDHDIFRPDLNAGFGQRGSNLRTDWAIDPVQGSSSVLHNSDYQSTGNGGICLSCHTGSSCDGCHSAHKSPRDLTRIAAAAAPVAHTFIPKANYDAATSAHNYSVPTTFATDGSVFNANCSKCHNDDMSKSYQNSAYRVSVHGSSFTRILDTTGIPTPADPLEEDFCFKCHSTTSNPNAGANQDYFGVQPMSVRSLGIETAFGLSSNHPVGSYTGVHASNEDVTALTRHVECEDCHNPHAATAAQPASPALSGALYGAIGIDIFGARIDPVTNSYQICFKCHGDSPGTTQLVTRQFNNGGNTRLEFDTASVSYHPVVGVGKNNNSPSLINGWTETSVMTCEDCHAASSGSADGPHGSQFSPILKLRYDTGDFLVESSARYALCYSCHDRNSILGDQSFKEHDLHIIGEDAPCSVCHDAHGSTGQAHLINFDTNVCTPVMSQLSFIDDGQFRGRCYVDCHGKRHNPKSY